MVPKSVEHKYLECIQLHGMVSHWVLHIILSCAGEKNLIDTAVKMFSFQTYKRIMPSKYIM